MKSYTKPVSISLKQHPQYTEKYIQTLIAEDPSILGIGTDLILRDQERIQPRAGRLDLLLQDQESKRRYEVELQLGETDESHIIRTIEYWEIERKRYPQYDHCAVLIAEDITSRFLNVISLFNGSIPLIAIQMKAFQVGEEFTILFTTVLDEFSRGLVDDDEEAIAAPTDRAYWEARSNRTSLNMADELLKIAREFDPQLELKYNKFYIGLWKDRQPNNFIQMCPRKQKIALEVKIKPSKEIENKIDDSGLDRSEYNTRWGFYRIPLAPADIKKNGELIKELISLAFENRNS